MSENVAVTPAVLTPAVYGKEVLPKRSKHYKHIDSESIVEVFGDHGWVPHQCSQVNTRNKQHTHFSKHLVTFRHPEMNKVNGIIPQIVLINSHDGSTSAKLMAGLYRFLCANGLIVSENEFSTVRVRHSGNALEEISDGIKEIVTTVPLIVGKSEDMNSLILTEREQLKLSDNVIQRVWTKDQNKPFEPKQLIEARRSEDKEPTLWNTYNVIQENLVKGGLVGTTSTNRERVMRGITNIDRNVKVNQILWEETDKFLKAA